MKLFGEKVNQLFLRGTSCFNFAYMLLLCTCISIFACVCFTAFLQNYSNGTMHWVLNLWMH